MRPKLNRQNQLDFSPPPTKETLKYHEKYEAISDVLDANPEILNSVQRDLEEPLKYAKTTGCGGRAATFTSDNVLRILIVMILESMSLRRVTVQIDDNPFLRRFTRIHDKKMMSFTTLDKLKNSIRPETWVEVNRTLASHAVAEELISGETLRIDTTAVPTNIHHPTDSFLLWDCYRVLARLIGRAREIDATVVGAGRLQVKLAKKINQRISRSVGKKNSKERLRKLYSQLIILVDTVLEWSSVIVQRLALAESEESLDDVSNPSASAVIEDIEHYLPLCHVVRDQSWRRVICGESVPNSEKIFSIFEDHTELLKRGKSWADIEYGHMTQIAQTSDKFIVDYEIFRDRPVEHKLLEPAIERHKSLFGSYPETLATDRGYFDGEIVKRLRTKIEVVSVPKSGGKRTEEEINHEHSWEFKQAQKFRAGVEGSISFLKRILGLWRCFSKGWAHYQCTIGLTVLAHNLLNLAVP